MFWDRFGLYALYFDLSDKPMVGEDDIVLVRKGVHSSASWLSLHSELGFFFTMPLT